MKCPKCSFEIQGSEGAACPRCGVVFAKVRRAMEEESALRRSAAAERSLSAAVESQMEADEEVRSRFSCDLDPEYARDETAYPVIRFLSGFFAFLAVFTALTEAVGLLHFYQWGKTFLDQREMFLIMVSLVVASAGSVVVLLAISEGLKMGRDVANHTRAMREYLRRGLR